MLNLKTPGVYIQEISVLPASVAPVATAIPAFVGYTQRREKDGRTLSDYEPVRIESLPEYREIFGPAFDENYRVRVEDGANPSDPPIVSLDGTYTPSPYLLAYAVEMYFANGGGPCYVISAGVYDLDNPAIDNAHLSAGIDAIEQEDEPTILVVPEIVQLTNASERKALNDKMLTQCNKLQDRFAVMDVVPNPANTVKQDGDDFRDEVSLANLKYGAAYYPYLKTIIPKYYQDTTTNMVDVRAVPVFNGESLKVVAAGFSVGAKTATGTITFNSRYKGVATETINIGGTGLEFKQEDGGGSGTIDIGATAAETATNFATAVNGSAAPVSATADGAKVTLTADTAGVAGNDITIVYSGSSGVKIDSGTLEGGAEGSDQPDIALYNQVKALLDGNRVELPPSSSIAGIYARVDRERGVWKAPANVPVLNIQGPAINITSEEQSYLNVDATSGKSINAIRTFKGKGHLVWGARTLAGNDNEWRYVPVRRLYINVEESLKKATEPVVFEPNDANTWTKVRGMAQNFLTKLWREGALQGAVADDAFFVKIGLGETMTQLDILEGRLNVEIGLAAVRPAEFIVLTFSHYFPST